MKKWLMPFFTAMFMMAAALGASAEVTYKEVYNDSIYTLTLTDASSSQEGYVYIAVKDSSGMLKSVKTNSIEWSGTVGQYTETVVLSEGDTVKAFIWDKYMNPIITTEGIKNVHYTVDSRMVIASGTPTSTYENNKNRWNIPVLGEDGSTINLMTEDKNINVYTETGECSVYPDVEIQKGTAFIYSVNPSGNVDEIRIILEAPDVKEGSAAIFKKCGTLDCGVTFDGKWGNTVEFMLYPVIKKYQDSIELAIDFDNTSMLSSDCGESFVYYDTLFYIFDKYDSELVSVGRAGDMVASSISKNGRVDYDDTIVDWSSDNNIPAFALVRVYEGDIQDIYSISLD